MRTPCQAVNLWWRSALPALLLCGLFSSPPNHAQTLPGDANQPSSAENGEQASGQDLEGRPLRIRIADYSVQQEQENVTRLLNILAQHYADLQESQTIRPSPEAIALGKATQRDAAELAHIPYSADKIRLSGAEGSAALARVSKRLNDTNIPDSRRNITRIFSVKTRLQGTLLSSENHSLRPVGKNNYVALIRLQPGDTTIEISNDRWEVNLPKDISSKNYLLTLYIPPEGKAEFHIFSVPDLLAQEAPYIPAWLPADFKLTPPAG